MDAITAKRLLFFDSETSGLPDFNLPLNDPRQPHIVQLAAVMTDGDGREKNSMNFLIRPEGYTISPEVTKIHGITHEDAVKYGMGLKGVVMIMKRWIGMADMVIGHNIKFDQWMLRRDAVHTGEADNYYEYKEVFDTMEETREIMAHPPTDKMMAAGFKQSKSPKLSEVYQHMFGEPLFGAHDAMTDVIGCKRVYFRIMSMRSGM